MEIACATHIYLRSAEGKMVKYIFHPCLRNSLPCAWPSSPRAEKYNLSFISAGQDVSDDYMLEFVHIYNETKAS